MKAAVANRFDPGANSASKLIAHLQEEYHRVIGPIIEGASSLALIDFPDHNNVGDSAIWLGELAYLKRRFNREPSYVCRADRCDYKRLEGRFADSLILLHGGGNFGDLWRWHHDKREALLEHFTGRSVIQMPQSLKFDSQQSLKRTADIIARHGNFTLLVRDQASFELANASFDCRVILCPDSAFNLGPLPRRSLPHQDVLFLLRDDHERVGGVREAVADFAGGVAMADDWQMDVKLVRALRKLLAASKTVQSAPGSVADGDKFRSAYFNCLAEARLERGLQLLSSSRYVVTDRLHAYILALLLDIPCAVIDNSYGKLSGFVSTWMQADEQVKIFNNLGDAISEVSLPTAASAT